jgi:ribosomal protein S18 acetylase RimI-like enzyme
MPVLSSAEFLEEEDYRLRSGINRLTSGINETSSLSFGHSAVSDNVGTAIQKGEYIGYLEMNGKVVAHGFGKEDTSGEGPHKTMYIHTFSVNSEYRGQGLCQKIVLEFVKKFKKHILYLTVRTEVGNVNESAIRCYEKNGFTMLPEVYRDHYDGKNNAMVRFPTSGRQSRRTTSRQTRRKKKGK